MSVVQMKYYNGSAYTNIYPRSNLKYFTGNYTGTGENTIISISLPSSLNTSDESCFVGIHIMSTNTSFRTNMFLPLSGKSLEEGIVFTYNVNTDKVVSIAGYVLTIINTNTIKIMFLYDVMNILNTNYRYMIFYSLAQDNTAT